MAELPGMQQEPKAVENPPALQSTEPDAPTVVTGVTPEAEGKAPGEPLNVSVLGGGTPTPSPSPTPSPTVDVDPDDDFEPSYVKQRAEDEARALIEEARLSVPRKPSTGPTQPEEIRPEVDPAQVVKDYAARGQSVALDVAHGIGESPSQVLGGMRDGAQALINGLGDMANYVTEAMPDFLQGGLVSDAEGTRILGKEEYQKWKEKSGYKHTSLQLPEVKKPQSVTGGVIRGVSQFLLGFGVAGKVVGKGVGLAGEMAKGAAKGAISDFTVFEGHEKNLANLLKEHTPLRGPVLDFLATSPGDNEALNRLKNSLTGVVTGVGSEMAIKGLVKALSLIRQGRSTKAVQELIQKVDGAEVPKEFDPKTDLHVLGDPEKPLIVKEADDTASKLGAEKKTKDSAKDTKGTTPEEVLSEPGKAKTGDSRINWAAINSVEDVQKLLKKMSQLNRDGVNAERRGTRSWEKTKLSAEQENAWKILAERRRGEALNAEELVALKQLWISSAEKLKEVAKVARDTPTDANMFAFRKMLVVHDVVQKQAMGAIAEAGRALNAMKIPVGGPKVLGQHIDAVVQSAGGTEVVQKLAKSIADFADAKMDLAIEMGVEKGVMAKTMDAVGQIWINGLLTRPTSHVKNLLSNFAYMFSQVMERKVAERMSQAFGDGGVEAGEAVAMMHGMIQGFRESLLALRKGKAPLEGITGFVDDNVKFQTRAGALASETWNISNETWLGRALDLAEKASQKPGRLMGAGDQYFKLIAYRMEINAQALRRATAEVRAGKVKLAKGVSEQDAIMARMQELVNNPPDDLAAAGVTQARYQTFTQKPAQAAARLADAWRSIPVLGRLTLPFRNTPINVATAALERSPLAPLVKQWRMDIAAGGSRRDVALARMATGTAVAMTVTDLALSGKITGKGPQEPNQRALWKRAGNQEYSIKIGDKWVSYSTVDPLGMTLGMAADYAEAVVNAQKEIGEESFEEVFTAMTLSFANNVTSRSYMSGMADLLAAVTNSEMKGMNFAKRVTSSAIPTIGGAITQQGIPGVLTADPYMRTANSMVDAMRRKIPGLSETLPLYRDLWGRTVDIRSGNGWAYDMFVPFYVKKENPEPIDSELLALNHFPDMPDKEIMVNGVKFELDGHQYSRYVSLAGNELKHPAYRLGCKDFLNAVVSGKHPLGAAYREMKRIDAMMGSESAINFIKNTMSQYREMAKQQLMREDGGLKALYDYKIAGKKGRASASQLFGR